MEHGLSEEQKRRIEAEEAARLAEERYREQVRQSIRAPIHKSLSRDSSSRMASEHRPSNTGLKVALIIFGVMVIGWGVVSVLTPSAASSGNAGVAAFMSPWEQVAVPIVSEQFQVPAGHYRSWPLDVPSGVRNFHVTGRYSASGGSGNDIQAVIAAQDDFENWINAHQAHVFYSSSGLVTTGHIDVMLPPGHYVLGFSNRAAILLTRSVFAEITATYEKLK